MNIMPNRLFLTKVTNLFLASIFVITIVVVFLNSTVNTYDFFQVSSQEQVTNIALIKIHKSASTTLANIIYRYGIVNNLTFLLPRDTKLAQFWPYPITSSRILPNCKEKFNILNVHSKFYGRDNIHLFMPHSTKIIAILRHPAPQLKSTYNYYGISTFGSGNPLDFHEFLNAPAQHIQGNKRANSFRQLLWNGMSNDLGLMNSNKIPWGLTKSDILSDPMYSKFVDNFLSEIEESIDIMLISEYFEESMVLLKMFLNWNWDDLAYLSLNKAKDTTTIQQFNSSQIEKIVNWNYIDYMLYTRMLQKFLQQINLANDEISEGIETLRLINEKYQQDCVKKTRVDPRLFGANAILGYQLNTQGRNVDKCKQMTLDELTCVRQMREHMKLFCDSL